jgi:hypothetical protein
MIDIHALDHFRRNAKSIFLQEITQAIPINQIDGCRPVSRCFFRGLSGEMPRCYQNPLISSSLHCPPKIADLLCTDTAFPFLALKIHLERDKVYAQNANSIDSPIARFPTHLYFREAGFTKKALSQSFESIRGDGSEPLQKQRLPVFFSLGFVLRYFCISARLHNIRGVNFLRTKLLFNTLFSCSFTLFQLHLLKNRLNVIVGCDFGAMFRKRPNSA